MGKMENEKGGDLPFGETAPAECCFIWKIRQRGAQKYLCIIEKMLNTKERFSWRDSLRTTFVFVYFENEAREYKNVGFTVNILACFSQTAHRRKIYNNQTVLLVS
jgi:hypothetical protein